jgi:serine/threonine protein kinase/Tol biopolymer transport system component
MSLSPGVRLGAYEILAQIGAGGMGEVYRAKDTRLHREVAIKVLPDLFALDADRLARFKREAQVLASLNHPNIAAIYGLEESNGVQALVLELVEGPTLADRISQAQIPLDEALPIARQIADGLEAAHEQGIVHRDLKPANIKITHDGKVKVLDFGLAKMLSSAEAGHYHSTQLSMSPTLSVHATYAGVILGTAAYMSPEQARGKQVDKRTDIFAFGCVLHEMLAGHPAFQGEDATEILGRVVTGEPDWTKLPAGIPPRIRELLGRCLQKDPKLRLRDIGDTQFELRNPGAPPSAETAAERPAARRINLIATGIAVGLMVLAFIAGSKSLKEERPSLPARLSIMPLEGHRVTSGPIITRDGGRVAFVSTDGKQPPLLYIRRLDSFELRAIPGSEDADKPFFSPDGRWVAYFAKGQLFKVDLEGGAPAALAEAPLPAGGTWAEDGTIVFTPTWNSGLYRISASGGRAELIIRPDAANKEYALVWPYFLPGGKELLFTVWGQPFSISHLTLPELKRSVVAPNFWTSSAYAASGHILAGSETGDLQAVRYDSKTAGGSPISVLQNVHWSGAPGDSLVKFGISLDGTLVYAPGDITQRSLVFVDETGKISPATAEHQPYLWLSVSPDGRKVAQIYGMASVWVVDLERGGRTLLAGEYRASGRLQPIWSPDGSRIFFGSNHEGNWEIYSKSIARPDTTDIVLKKELDQFPVSVAPDGMLAYVESHPQRGEDIWVLPPGGSPEPWLATKADELLPRFSPDGRLIAYVSNASGRYEVYLQPFHGQSERIQVSTAGGNEPAWSPRGERLYYREGNAMMAADVQTGARLSAGKPRRLFDGGWQLAAGVPFAVMPDGKRFLMVRYEPAAIPTRMDVIFNWFDELKNRVP